MSVLAIVAEIVDAAVIVAQTDVVMADVVEIVVEDAAEIVEKADAVMEVAVKVDKAVHVHHVVTKINFLFIKMIKPYSQSGCKVFLICESEATATKVLTVRKRSDSNNYTKVKLIKF